MANIINYNSWDTNFKTPFGALKTCESAIIKVESSKAFDVCSIKLIIEKEDENLNPVLVRELELQQSGENEKVREYTACSGFFSSDRTIKEYINDIWFKEGER